MYPEQKTIRAVGGHRVDPERGVLAVSDKPQLRSIQGVRAERLHGQVPQPGNLLAVRQHGAPSRADVAPGRGTYDQGRMLGLPDSAVVTGFSAASGSFQRRGPQ